MPVNFDEIRRRRAMLKISQAVAGERAGLDLGKQAAARWSIIENASKPDLRVSTLQRVALALECSVLDLLTPLDKAPVPPKAPKAGTRHKVASGSSGSKTRPRSSTQKVRAD